MFKKGLFLLFFFPFGVFASIGNGWGVSSAAFSKNGCAVDSGCDNQSVVLTGGQWQSTSNSYAYVLGGQGAGYSELLGEHFLPQLGVAAISGENERAQAIAYANQGYKYLGLEPVTLTLLIELHGGILENIEGSYSEGVIEAGVAIDKVLDDAVQEDGLIIQDLNDIFDHASNNLVLDGDTAFVADQITIDLVPGDEFFIIAELIVDVSNRYAGDLDEIYSQLVLGFVDDLGNAVNPALLEPASTLAETVPFPVSALFLLFVFLFFVADRLTQKSLQ